MRHVPFPIALAANLGVDDVKGRATCEVFQVLWSQSKSESWYCEAKASGEIDVVQMP